jgi:carboxylesterase
LKYLFFKNNYKKNFIVFSKNFLKIIEEVLEGFVLKKKVEGINIKSGAQTYYNYISKDIGVFLIHGFTGSPAEMIPFAKRFESKGFSVYCPRLAGHGTDINDFVNTTVEQWYQSAFDQYLEFKSRVKKTYIIGLSLGGQIATYLSYIAGCEKLALFSTPYEIPDSKMKYAKAISIFIKKIKKKEEKPSVFLEKARELMINYSDCPYHYTKPIYQLYRSFKFFHYYIRKTNVPIFIAQSELDPVSSFKSPQKIFNKSKSSKIKQMKYLKKSSHVITLDYEADELFSMTHDFFLTN